MGIANIIRFNWHFYALALISIIIGCITVIWLDGFWRIACWVCTLLVGYSLIVSLFTSMYIYDFSKLYDFGWIVPSNTSGTIVNIHSGFDESSILLKKRFPKSDFQVWDFYNPVTHTEPSIKRARRIYPSDGTTINTETLPQKDESVETIFLILAAHEIRDNNERIHFFRELDRILQTQGTVYVMEHLRDIPNFLAYTIGAFHFHSRKTWLRTFSGSGFVVASEKKHTPFISVFKLCKDGNTY